MHIDWTVTPVIRSALWTRRIMWIASSGAKRRQGVSVWETRCKRAGNRSTGKGRKRGKGQRGSGCVAVEGTQVDSKGHELNCDQGWGHRAQEEGEKLWVRQWKQRGNFLDLHTEAEERSKIFSGVACRMRTSAPKMPPKVFLDT